MPIRVHIIDAHDVIRSGLRSMLEAAGFVVLRDAATVEGLVDAAIQDRPDLEPIRELRRFLA